MFRYKTRGNASPQGKQKVYFTCHPDDFDRYYEKISDQLLDFADCAIWHWDSGEGYPDIQVDLQGMRLFVIPVTGSLLQTQNRTIDIDLPFALKNNVPVLPLMQESGLDELFDGKFGSLHYLDENARDDMALPYKEKLKRYLASVIIGDELAEKVRKAFDAYIFLSYRKQDRKYAQELMRLIHENDFCRDIAIWYDEFLVPGENFDDAIADALKKSELFALVVTPNLLKEEENYVRRREYPLARDARKKILPAELVETDRTKLAEMYEDIPDCVDPSDAGLLSEALLDALRSIAKRENDSDPEHNFFIGLAYLSGIDVETNARRARELIGSAAEAGLPEALEKLVSMYQNGDGVERDYHRAIEYQHRLAGLLREKYRKSGDPQDGGALGIALYQLGNYLYDVRSFSEAEAIYQELGAVSSRLANHWNLALSYDRIGDICQDRGRLTEAEGYYRKSLGLRKEMLAGGTQSVELRGCLRLSYERLGVIRELQGKLSEAEGFYRKTLDLSEILVRETQTVQSRRELANIYDRLGGICMDRRQFAEAEEFYRKFLELAEVLAGETQGAEERRNLALGYVHLGALREDQGELAEAESFYRKCLELRETLAGEIRTVLSRRDLVGIYYRLGSLREDQGELAEAEGFYWRSLELSEALVRETQTAESRGDVANVYSRLGLIREAQGDLAGAEGFFRKSLGILEVLGAETQKVVVRSFLAQSYLCFGDIRREQGDLAETEALKRKALEILEALARETQTEEAYREVAECCYWLGDLRKDQGDFVEAVALRRKALEILEALARETQTEEAYRKVAERYYWLGNLCKKQGDMAEAEGFYQKSLELMNASARETQ